MANEIETVQLSYVTKIIKRGISPKYDEFEGAPVLNQRCIRNNIISWELARKNNLLKKKIPEDRWLEKFDVLVNSTGVGTLGRVAQLIMISEPSTVDSHVTIVRPKTSEIDPYFFGFAIRSKEYEIEALGEGSTGQTELSRHRLAEIEIPILPLPEQKAIAHVLGSLDDKIELNRRMNETLEAMAQALFKSWFVDFDPVIDNALAIGKKVPEDLRERAAARAALGDKRKPLPEEIRTLFSNEFTFSDELGWIPVGWEVGPLKEIASLKTTSIQPKNEPETVWVHFSIPAFDENRLPNNELGDTIKSGKYKVPPTAVLASKLNPQFPRVWLPDVENDETAICSTEFMPFVPLDERERPFLFVLLSSSIIQEEIASRATGSTGSRQRVKPRDIEGMSVLKPPKDLRIQFSNLADSYYLKVTANIRVARHLANLRDTLLPKLLTGELRIPDAEKMVEGLA